MGLVESSERVYCDARNLRIRLLEVGLAARVCHCGCQYKCTLRLRVCLAVPRAGSVCVRVAALIKQVVSYIEILASCQIR